MQTPQCDLVERLNDALMRALRGLEWMQPDSTSSVTRNRTYHGVSSEVQYDLCPIVIYALSDLDLHVIRTSPRFHRATGGDNVPVGTLEYTSLLQKNLVIFGKNI